MFGLSKRWEMVLLMCSGVVVVYTLRVNMSVAVDDMSEELDWSDYQKGLILSSFYWGYACGQIPAIRLAHRTGFKFLFGISVVVPSILTLFVPVVCKWNFILGLLLRALIGFVESASFPCVYTFFTKWVAPQEKTLMVTCTASGMYIGEIIGFSLSGILTSTNLSLWGMSIGGWPSVFYIFGLAGIFWYPLWLTLAHESPNVHPTITQLEIDFINRPASEPTDKENLAYSKLPTTEAVLDEPLLLGEGEGEGEGLDGHGNKANKNVDVCSLSEVESIDIDSDSLSFDSMAHSRYMNTVVEGELFVTENRFSHAGSSASRSDAVKRLQSQHRFASRSGEATVSPLFFNDAAAGKDADYSGKNNNDGENGLSLGKDEAGIDTEGCGRIKKRIKREAPWREFFTHPSSLTLILACWQYGWIGFMLISEMPTYLTDELDMDIQSAGILCIIPFFLLFVFTIGFGTLFDWLQRVKGWPVRKVRQWAQFIAFGGPAVFLIITGYLENRALAFTSMCLAQALLGASQSGVSCAFLDIAPYYSARYNTVGNTIGAIAGIASPIIVSVFTTIWDGSNGWRAVFFLTAAQSALALLCWYFFQTSDIIPALNTPGKIKN